MNTNDLHEITQHLVGEQISISHLEDGKKVFITRGNRPKVFLGLTFNPVEDEARAEATVFDVSYAPGRGGNSELAFNSTSNGEADFVSVQFANIFNQSFFTINSMPEDYTNRGTRIFLNPNGDGTVIIKNMVPRNTAPLVNSLGGSYWSFYTRPGVAMVQLVNSETISPEMEFNIHIHQPELEDEPPLITECELKEAELIWEITGGLILALSIGSGLINEEKTGSKILQIIKENDEIYEAFNELVEDLEKIEDKVNKAIKVLKFLRLLLEENVLWKVAKFILTEAGFWVAFKVLGKVVEAILAPEAEVANLIIDLEKWEYSLAQAISEYRKCLENE